MAEKKVKINIEVDGNVEGSIAQLKELKKQLKQTAVGSDEWKKLFNQIDDLEDKIKSAKGASSDWIDTLESAGGPLGMLGGALNKVKVATQSWGAALKATGIGLLVSLLAGLVGAFSSTEGAMKKFQPLLIGMERIFNGILSALQPVIDGFINLATKAMPFVTDAFRISYSVMSSFLQGLGKIGSAVSKLIKGDFTGAWEDAKSSVTDFGKRYDQASKSFIEGTKKLTDTEKQNTEDRNQLREKELEKIRANLDAKIELEITKENTSREVLKELLDKRYKAEIENKKLSEAEKEKIRADYAKKLEDALNEDGVKQLEIAKKNQEKLSKESIEGIEAQKQKELDIISIALSKQEITEEQARKKIFDINKKAAEDTLVQLESTKNSELNELEGKNLKAEEYAKQKADIESNYDNQILAKKKEINGLIVSNDTATNQEIIKNKENAKNERLLGIENEFFDITTSYDRKKELIQAREKELLDNSKLTEEQRKQIKQQSAQDLAAIEMAELEASTSITMAKLDLAVKAGQLLQQIAGKNKAVAIAGLVIEKAATIGQIVASTALANAKSVAAFPVTFGQPWVTINTISAGLSIATTIAAAVKAIGEINSQSVGPTTAVTKPAESPAPTGRKFADGGLLTGPSHSSGGIKTRMGELEGGEFVINKRSTSSFLPMLNAINSAGNSKYENGGMTASMDAIQTMMMNQPQSIVKTYVVASDIYGQAEADKKLADLARL